MTTDQSTLNKLHIVLVEILDEFVRICEENNLTYFLHAGTLLGAVRHKGFIPWDDDLDVGMPRKDYEKFIRLDTELFNNKYYILSYKTKNEASKYCLNFAKFCKTGTIFAESYKESGTYSGIYIDIFPFDNCAPQSIFFQAFLKNLALNIYRVKVNAIYKKTFKYLLAKIFCFFIPLKIINYIHENLFLNNINTKKLSYLSSIYGYKRESHNYNVIFPLSKIIFENKYYFSPNNYDSYLKTMYGGYMTLPPEEDRRTHLPEYIVFNN